MSLTPQDIQTQEFHVRFRGFDVEEVDGFLEKIADEFTTLIEQNNKLTEQVESLNQEMSEYQSKGKAFQHAILSAQQIVDELKEKSTAEAEEIINGAKNEAEEIIASANSELATLQAEIERLENLKNDSTTELQRVLSSYLEMINAPSDRPIVPEIAPEPEPVAATQEPEEDDLSDLYQKIDLPDETTFNTVPFDEPVILEDAETEDTEPEVLTEAGAEEEQPEEEAETADEPYSAIPDLDEEVVFDLDDPLDANEPSVDFANLMPKDNK
ncbi:MAG: DivIVA domain-containing protein [Desulfobulbaceae bacterium]|nr:DivIVA domain-containing protein [Desulfobulbaceae bacterium]